MEEYEFELFSAQSSELLVLRMNELGKEGWHNPTFLPFDRLAFIMQRKLKSLSSTPPDDTNPQLLSEEHPSQSVTQQ